MKNLNLFLLSNLLFNVVLAENLSKESVVSSNCETAKSCGKSSKEDICACEKILKDNKNLTELCESCKNKSQDKMVTEIDYEDGQNHVDIDQDNIELDNFSDMSDEQLLNFLNQLSQELNLIEKDNDVENNEANSFDNLEISKEELQQLLGNITSIKSNN